MHYTNAYKHMLCSVDWYFEVGSHCAVDAGVPHIVLVQDTRVNLCLAVA